MSRRRCPIAFLLFASLALGRPAAAQRLADLPVGAELRIHMAASPPLSLKGQLLGVDSGALTLRVGAGDTLRVGLGAYSDHRNPCVDCHLSATGAAVYVGIGITALSPVIGGAIGLARRSYWVRVAKPAGAGS